MHRDGERTDESYDQRGRRRNYYGLALYSFVSECRYRPLLVFIGDSRETAEEYGWDSEYGEAKFEIEPFTASEYLVSNREFYEFVQWGKRAYKYSQTSFSDNII